MTSDATVNLSLAQFKEIERETDSLKDNIKILENKIIELNSLQKRVLVENSIKTIDYLLFDFVTKYKHSPIDFKLSKLDAHIKSYGDVKIDDNLVKETVLETTKNFINFDDTISEIRKVEELKFLTELNDLRNEVKQLNTKILELTSEKDSLKIELEKSFDEQVKKIESDYKIKGYSLKEEYVKSADILKKSFESKEKSLQETISQLKTDVQKQIDNYNYYVEQMKFFGFDNNSKKTENDEIITKLSEKIEMLENESYKTISFWKFVKLKMFK